MNVPTPFMEILDVENGLHIYDGHRIGQLPEKDNNVCVV